MTAILVNDLLIERVLRDPQLKSVGCLSSISLQTAPEAGRRPCCGKKVRLTPSIPYQKVRQCLYGLSDVDLQKLKQLLKVDQLIFYFKEPGYPPRAVR
jgi:hypothetical protein